VLLVKTHGSLNEIFAAQASPEDFASDAELCQFVRTVCDRESWTGGGDGIYFFDPGTSTAQAWVFNPDGSSAEFCGNGMRGLGRLLLDMRGTDTEVIASGGWDYTVRRVATTPEGVRQVSLELPEISFIAAPDGPFHGFTAVTVPNPHVVAMVGRYFEQELIDVGKCAADWFAEGVNVSFLLPLESTRGEEVFVRTFERGAGLTPSCGSGVVASRAAYSRVTGRDPRERIVVRNVGGAAVASINVRDGSWFPVLEGNGTIVYRTETDTEGNQLSDMARDDVEVAAYHNLYKGNLASLRSAGITVRSAHG
jgi:diaminopimelate epimerase